MRIASIVIGLILVCPIPAISENSFENQSTTSQESLRLGIIDSPTPPIAPNTINRDEEGRATIRAIRLNQPLQFDGRLDEELYREITPVNGFLQQYPNEGEPATERTDIWILFDDQNLYISAFCYETHPERQVARELRRDERGVSQQDNLSISLDTFYDRRNGVYFQTNPLGVIREQSITDASSNSSWNTVWDAKVMNTTQGYTVEMMIPFKSLRYRRAGSQIWGINVRRQVKWKNETSYLNPMPVSYGTAGILQMAIAATLVGLETPEQSVNIELKPYMVSSLTTNLEAAVPFNNDPALNVGLDFKYGLTRSITADVTINTDFAQVEEDVQQVNLTRFSLFFPEKRDFFLEGQGIFGFSGQGDGGPSDGFGDVPTMFFSRRIGLSKGQPVPAIAGARVTGKAGDFDLGLINIQTGNKPSADAVATNFSVVRIKRDILRRSNIGFLVTRRGPSMNHNDSNFTLGIDANLRFFENIESNLYWARTATPGILGSDVSYRGLFEYAGDRYGFRIEQLMVGDKFNPEIGFVRRDDFRRSSVNIRFSPRTTNNRIIRQLTWESTLDYITNANGSTLENRDLNGNFEIEFHSSDSFSLSYISHYEFLPNNFTISSGVIIPSDGYNFYSIDGSYELGQQRKISGTVEVSRGSLYGGNRTTIGYNGRISISSRFALEPEISFNLIDLPFGKFKANLLTTRVIVTPTPRLFFSSLIQFNASAETMSSSIRMRWEYIPGSEFFVVYSDGRNTSHTGYPNLLNRTFAVKLTRLFRL